ncbi:hypothetical protein ASE48_20125 [Mycobacterium sp. Root265]|uniref:AlbA family DNA-binding domain-containing protein n=1 Tax=Mycobacterium sp. Root265 TaxID=1736504 RepID=UPI0007090304|nr:ATP-binding protein [Mycobacterium sp. Root265]KRD04950.1 hypothetical protein ASE48_20125 [Mycobacterium sp. Root265]
MTDDPAEEPVSAETPADQAFVDGRTDYEKLVELLAFPEGTHLDFKAELDLGSTESKLKFAKDVVAMSNTPPGGYLLIGVDNDGKLCTPTGTINRPSFDGARLGDLVRPHIEGRVNLQVAVHDHLNHEVVVILVLPHHDGLPVPMSKAGNYQDPENSKKQINIFRQGDVPVREGPANVPLRHAHWRQILSVYSRQVRAEGTELAQAMLREFLNERGQSRVESAGSVAIPVPLLADMDELTFTSTMQSMLNMNDDLRLRRFLQKLAKTSLKPTASEDVFENGLSKWSIFCAQALFGGRTDLVEEAIEVLSEQYADLGFGDAETRKRLAAVVHIYALGSSAVRQADWHVVHQLALQPVPSNPYDRQYMYSSWIRHGQVDASRGALLPDRGGYLISAARDLLVRNPAMRPDVDDDEIPPADELAADDLLLNSLAEFDIAYCLIVAAEGKHEGGGYPMSAVLNDHRSGKMAERIVSKPEVRRALFPNSDDAVIAHALQETYRSASIEASRYGMHWEMPRSVRKFIEGHPTAN